MKSFRILIQPIKEHAPCQPALVVELSIIDVIRILFGREIKLPNKSTEVIVLRNAVAYSAFNMSAPRGD